MPDRLVEKLPHGLIDLLKDLPRIALAFSGGVDSRFLAHAALLCGCSVTAINARGPHIASAESAYAQAWASRRRIEFITFHYDPLAMPGVRDNSRDRCYVCKKGLLSRIAQLRKPGWQVCDGGNADDQNEFRPGLRAVAEAGVISPLALAGIRKAEIRQLAQATGMDYPQQPSKACLLSRLRYGLAPDHDVLQRISECEAKLQEFLESRDKVIEFRIRLCPAPVLQLTCNPAGFEHELVRIMARYGFMDAMILSTASISGFFDKPVGDMLG